MPLDLALRFPELPEAEHHQAHIDGIGSDANDAEIIEYEEQDPGQVDRTDKRHQGTQHQQDRCPAGPEATCKADKAQAGLQGLAISRTLP